MPTASKHMSKCSHHSEISLQIYWDDYHEKYRKKQMLVRDVEKREHTLLVWPLWETIGWFLKRSNIRVTYEQATISSYGICKRNEN